MLHPSLFCGRVEFQFPDFNQYRAILSSTGHVRWEPAGTFQTSCKIDITFYPYDTQLCSLVFGTWSYTSNQVNLTNSSNVVILDDYNESGEWSIDGTGVERREFIYECCPNIRFSKVAAEFYLIRYQSQIFFFFFWRGGGEIDKSC